MSRVGFAESVGVAALLACGSAAAYLVLHALLPAGAAFALTVPLAAAACACWLIGRAASTTGRVVVALGWCIAALALWAAAPAPVVLLSAHAILLWLLRVLFHHRGVLTGAIDFGLGMLAVAASVAAFRHTGSLLLAAWCFFLVQASFACLPARDERASPAGDNLARARHGRGCPRAPRAQRLSAFITLETLIMKHPLPALALFAATAVAVVLYPDLASHAGTTPKAPGAANSASRQAPPAVRQRPRIEVVFALDTTGSMGGLIHAAKDKIWSIAASMAQADPAPEIRMGLVAYRDRGDEYVTRVVDLSSDLDSMYAALMDFRASGGGDGPEAVNQALADAVERMSWSGDDNVYRVVFLVGDAPPHMDYQGERRYPEIVALANARGIVVNAIQCGSQHDTARIWQHIAALAQGDYITVGQNGGAVAVSTPFDGELGRLAAEMDGTRVFFGAGDAHERAARKERATAKLHAAAAPEALARRALFNASAAGEASFAGDHELVEAVTSGRVALDTIAADALPAPLAAMSAEERRAHVAAQATKRAQLKASIARLAARRDAYIAAELEARGARGDSLDDKLYDTVRRQAAEVGLHYEAEAKH